eukprot:8071370-Ditylum_brightwellii.AAC.1
MARGQEELCCCYHRNFDVLTKGVAAIFDLSPATAVAAVSGGGVGNEAADNEGAMVLLMEMLMMALLAAAILAITPK